MQGKGTDVGAEIPPGWEGCMSMSAQAEGEVRGDVKTRVSSLSFARSKIWAPGEAEGVVESDGG